VDNIYTGSYANISIKYPNGTLAVNSSGMNVETPGLFSYTYYFEHNILGGYYVLVNFYNQSNWNLLGSATDMLLVDYTNYSTTTVTTGSSDDTVILPMDIPIYGVDLGNATIQYVYGQDQPIYNLGLNISSLSTQQQSTFYDRFKNNTRSINSVCEDAEWPWDTDCQITLDSLSCSKDRCMYNEMWFAKLCIIAAIIMLIFEFSGYIILGLLAFVAINFIYIPTTQVITQIPNAAWLKYGSNIWPSQPLIGTAILVTVGIITIFFIFNKFTGRRKR
jgi:hypothetical protein